MAVQGQPPPNTGTGEIWEQDQDGTWFSQDEADGGTAALWDLEHLSAANKARWLHYLASEEEKRKEAMERRAHTLRFYAETEERAAAAEGEVWTPETAQEP